MTKQTQIRIPEEIKNEFRQVCLSNNTTMTTEIVRFIKGYIQSQMKDARVMTSLNELDMTRRTGMVRDVRGTWVPKEQVVRNNGWSW